ncbi:hypothetical protein DQ04_00931090 [Trypanosoma grayi]|uniref:hypothetical protein n=1 Tax=Trypanosoma grayi TaxID=71804 RepID=UPI0004F48BF2|nr:hypothetical protein DQ04_00931090 [Trypanosoma grayi]KEG13561.1 hypothetical protein DQ04_00931090 [Trypanosoma grayi]
MSEPLDSSVGVPYLPLRYIPRDAALLFPFLATRPRAPHLPRVYAASLALEYTPLRESTPSVPFPDVDFSLGMCFIIVGYRGVLCGRVTNNPKTKVDSGESNSSESRNSDACKTPDAQNPLWRTTLLPFCSDSTLHPALGSVFRVYTTEEDPAWLLLMSHEQQRQEQQQQRERPQGRRILAVRVVRIPVVAEARRLRGALTALLRHHCGDSVAKEVCRSLASVKELLTTALEYSYRSGGNTGESLRLYSLSSRLTADQYIHLAEVIISKQLASVVNTAVPIMTHVPPLAGRVGSGAQMQGFGSGGTTNRSDVEMMSLPTPLESALTALREEVEQKRVWLSREQQRRTDMTEVERQADERHHAVLQELELVRAQYRDALREGNKLMTTVSEEEQKWNALAKAREEERRTEEERLTALEQEYSSRFEESRRELEELRTEKSRVEMEEAAREAARVEMVHVMRIERESLLQEVELLDEQLAEMLREKRERAAETTRPLRRKGGTRCRKTRTFEETRAQNTALNGLLQKLNSEIEEEDQKEVDLAGDLHAFTTDIDELEKRKILLELEYSLLADTSLALRQNLEAQAEALNAQQEAIAASKKQMPTRLLVQLTRTRKSLIVKENAAALLRRLKANLGT